MRAAVIAAVFAIACGGSRAKPVEPPSNKPAAEPAARPAERPIMLANRPPTDAEFDAIMERAVDMFTAIGTVADQAGNDCGKLAAGVERIMNANLRFFELAKKWKGDPDIERRGTEWMQAHQDKIMPPMMKFAGAAQKCMTDPKFAVVMDRFAKLGD